MHRRTVLQGLAASTLPLGALHARDGGFVARPGSARILPDDLPETPLWTYRDSFPGPELRHPQGSVFEAEFVNELPQPSTIHWHGIRIANAMDGVPGVTQAPVAPGERFWYRFALPDAGTCWYHSHLQSVEQVERGLYGPLIVTEDDPPDVDHDLTLMLDDIRLDRDGQVSAPFDAGFDRSHGGRIGNIVLTNGVADWRGDVRRGDRLRLRLINAATARIFDLRLMGLEGWVVALDGMPLRAPERVTGDLTLGPAQRIDLIVDVTAEAQTEAFLLHIERDGGYAQATFAVGAGTRAARPEPGPLPPNPDFPITLEGARTATVLMAGGAMRGLSEATHEGQLLTGRALAERNLFWALNGQAGRSDTPLVTAELGETVRLALGNDTAFAHAMHLHGMHFSQVLADGTLGPLRDTLLMAPGETAEIAFAAHNPGDWLFHCHMLSHHAAGMGTFVRVT